MNRLFHGEPVPEKQIHPVGNSGVLPRLRTSTWNFNYFSLTVKGGAGRGGAIRVPPNPLADTYLVKLTLHSGAQHDDGYQHPQEEKAGEEEAAHRGVPG